MTNKYLNSSNRGNDMTSGFLEILMYVGIFIVLIIIMGIVSIVIDWTKERFPNKEEKIDSILINGMFFTPIVIIALVVGVLFFSTIGEGGGVRHEDYSGHDTYNYNDNSPGTHFVKPYNRSDGTPVRGHYRSNPDGNPYNNLNAP